MGTLCEIERRPMRKTEIQLVIAGGYRNVPSRMSMRSEDRNATDLSGPARAAGEKHK